MSKGLSPKSFFQIVSGQLGIFQDFQKQTGADDFACVNWNNRVSAIGMTQRMVAAANANDLKSVFFENADKLFSTKPG